MNEQLKRDQELLKILEVREKEMEQNFYIRQMPLSICTKSTRRR